MFVVGIASELYGDTLAVAQAITATELTVDMYYRPPLGTVVIVVIPNHSDPIATMRARAEVTGIAIGDKSRVTFRLVEFIDTELPLTSFLRRYP